MNIHEYQAKQIFAQIWSSRPKGKMIEKAERCQSRSRGNRRKYLGS